MIPGVGKTSCSFCGARTILAIDWHPQRPAGTQAGKKRHRQEATWEENLGNTRAKNGARSSHARRASRKSASGGPKNLTAAVVPPSTGVRRPAAFPSRASRRPALPPVRPKTRIQLSEQCGGAPSGGAPAAAARGEKCRTTSGPHARDQHAAAGTGTRLEVIGEDAETDALDQQGRTTRAERAFQRSGSPGHVSRIHEA
jgi:hypothetical protein